MNKKYFCVDDLIKICQWCPFVKDYILTKTKLEDLKGEKE